MSSMESDETLHDVSLWNNSAINQEDMTITMNVPIFYKF